MLAEAQASLLNELRAATAARHAALDGMLALLDDNVSLARYETFLRGRPDVGLEMDGLEFMRALRERPAERARPTPPSPSPPTRARPIASR